MAQIDIPLFYDTDLRNWVTEAGASAVVSKILLGQLCEVDIILAVIKDGVAIELTTPSWILGIKELGDTSGDYLIQETSAVKTGTGTSTRYTFTFTFDSVELRAFLATLDPAEDYCCLEIRDTVNGIVTSPALTIAPLAAYTTDGTTPTDASGILIVASGKTATISNTITLTGTDGESYNLDTVSDIPAVRYTASQGLTAQQQGYARDNISAAPATEVKSASFTAENNGYYTVVASATATDPSPVEGEGFSVLVRNGTATVGGTAYSTAGVVIQRVYHSGAWTNYVYDTVDAATTLSNKTLSNATTTGTLTLNGTTYTYGVGAATAHKTALSLENVDNTSDVNKPVSTAQNTAILARMVGPFSLDKWAFVEECFGGWLFANNQVYGNGAFSWRTWFSGSAGFSSDYCLENHPGCTQFYAASAGTLAVLMPSLYVDTSASQLIGSSFEFNFAHYSTGNSKMFLGFRGNSVATEIGRKGLFLDTSVDTAWQGLHETSAGVQTRLTTGKTFVSGEWVNVRIDIISASQTDITISTASSQTDTTISLTTGYSTSGRLNLGFQFTSTPATPNYFFMDRICGSGPRTRF